MRFVIPNSTKYLVFIDTEFDNENLVQFAAICLKEDNNSYVIHQSINFYINTELSFYFTKHNFITQDLLHSQGLYLDKASEQANKFFNSLPPAHTTLIAHGLKQDLQVIANNLNVDFSRFKQRYCTYNNAKTLELPCLKLQDIAILAGYVPSIAHDAFDDCKTTIAAYTLLKEAEGE